VPPLYHLTSCTHTKSNLYLAISLIVLYIYRRVQASNIPSTKFLIPFPLLRSYQRISPCVRHQFVFCNKIHFYGELLAPRPAPKLEDHPLSALRNCLFSVFAPTRTVRIGGRSSIRKLTTRRAVGTGTHL
jgi:hypothetical protein